MTLDEQLSFRQGESPETTRYLEGLVPAQKRPASWMYERWGHLLIPTIITYAVQPRKGQSAIIKVYQTINPQYTKNHS